MNAPSAERDAAFTVPSVVAQAEYAAEQSPIGGDPRKVTFATGHEWPTPMSCRRAANALDNIGPARFGDILRAYAEAEDERFDAHGPIGRTSVTSPGVGA